MTDSVWIRYLPFGLTIMFVGSLKLERKLHIFLSQMFAKGKETFTKRKRCCLRERREEF